MILPKPRDPRFITLRRGGTLTDTDHCLLARWTADCAAHELGAAAYAIKAAGAAAPSGEGECRATRMSVAARTAAERVVRARFRVLIGQPAVDAIIETKRKTKPPVE